MPQLTAIEVRMLQESVGVRIQIDQRFVARFLIAIKTIRAAEFFEQIRAAGPE
jgi:hypothetical protein